MKIHHLWVLGILFSGILVLAFLGFFKFREGFQSTATATATDVFITEDYQQIPQVDMTGVTFKNLKVKGSFVENSIKGDRRSIPIARAVSLSQDAEDGVFIAVAIDDSFLKMVLIQFRKTGATLSIRLPYTTPEGAGYVKPDSIPKVLTDEYVRKEWTTLVNKQPITQDAETVGYGFKNVQVTVVKEIPSGKSAADVITVNPNTINPANTLIRCPPGYTFFNGPNGDSMCCSGTVNPYTHTCSGPNVDTIKGGMCSLSGKVQDPRKKFEGETLEDCRMYSTREAEIQSTACPTSLPYYAKQDEGAEKCCKNPVQLYGESGFTCSDQDAKDTSNYCILSGVPGINSVDGKQEKLCGEAKMIDTATCPTDVTGNPVFQNITYTMGDREASRYDIADLRGLTIPACFRMNEVCIPENVIKYSQSRGAFTEYDPKTWEYSCSVWSRKNRGELVPEEVKGYLGVAANRT